jgi:hypothetical protein
LHRTCHTLRDSQSAYTSHKIVCEEVTTYEGQAVNLFVITPNESELLPNL